MIGPRHLIAFQWRLHLHVGAILLSAALLLTMCLSAIARAEEAPAGVAVACGLERGERWLVTEIVDGDTLVLETGDQVRLVGLQAPKLALGRRHFQDWPLAPEAKSALAALALGQAVTLYYGGRPQDRHGRVLAHLFLDDGRWVQGAMLEAGMARVYTFPDNRACVLELLAQESPARGRRVGIWGDDFYALKIATDVEGLLDAKDSFQLVEGKILAVARVRNRIFINFGSDWRDDFTLVIEGEARRRFPSDMEVWVGRDVRVRGWLGAYNGPEIKLTHPEQLEFLDVSGR